MEAYVFDSMSANLKTVFSIADVFVIDANEDGRVHIEMRLLNACKILER